MEYEITDMSRMNNGNITVKIKYRLNPESRWTFMSMTFGKELWNDGRWEYMVEDEMKKIENASRPRPDDNFEKNKKVYLGQKYEVKDGKVTKKKEVTK